METLQEAAIEMLKEFKVLLNFTPLPINANRLIQLLALNMFAIDNGQLKGMVTNDYICLFSFVHFTFVNNSLLFLFVFRSSTRIRLSFSCSRVSPRY